MTIGGGLPAATGPPPLVFVAEFGPISEARDPPRLRQRCLALVACAHVPLLAVELTSPMVKEAKTPHGWRRPLLCV